MTQASTTTPCPIVCPVQHVEEAWIDYNGHLNMAFYHVLFDRGLDHVYDLLGIGADHVARLGGSCFTLEVHVNYLRELLVGDPVRVHFQLLDVDAKRLHFFEHMYHADDGYLAATSEQLALYVDMQTRRSAPFPKAVMATLEKTLERHRNLAYPECAGRAIGIHRR